MRTFKQFLAEVWRPQVQRWRRENHEPDQLVPAYLLYRLMETDRETYMQYLADMTDYLDQNGSVTVAPGTATAGSSAAAMLRLEELEAEAEALPDTKAGKWAKGMAAQCADTFRENPHKHCCASLRTFRWRMIEKIEYYLESYREHEDQDENT